MSAPPAGTVVVVSPPSGSSAEHHECEARQHMARRLAHLKGYQFGGEFDRERHYEGALYFVPGETLLAEEAAQLGIHSIDNLFGGVVAAPVIATKCVTHPLLGAGAAVPSGWCAEFPERVRAGVLPGYSAFDREAALSAGIALLEQGAVRLKPGDGVGGRGQVVVRSQAELVAALDRLAPETLARSGAVLERNLDNVTTYSVGQVTLGDLRISYIGTQATIAHPRGGSVYGGSELLVVRGDFAVMAAVVADPSLRVAVELARLYDSAATDLLPLFMASRRNYDVVTGTDAEGRVTSGVLEQSWRIGGASPAEIAALEAFAHDPQRTQIRAASYECYDDGQLPADAVVGFAGVDRHGDRLVKYSRIWNDADPT